MDGNPQDLVNDALNFAIRGIQFDTDGKYDVAIYYYREASKILRQAAVSVDVATQENLEAKINEYEARSDVLEHMVTSTPSASNVAARKSECQSEYECAYFLLSQGLDEDAAGNKEEALELYTQAVELCLKARSHVTDPILEEKLTKAATQALERAEDLKGISKSPTPSKINVSISKSHTSINSIPPLGFNALNLGSQAAPKKQLHRGNSAHLQVTGNDAYSEEEKQVLRQTSVINNREYVPFMSVDLKERFAYPMPFTDKDGLLQLSPKQKSSFVRWSRPEEFCSQPKMMEVIDCFSIKQTVVSDCSFVASLAVSALYEKRFKKRVITSIIYPKNRNGDPVYNPCGKYMVKLHINGVPRKVIIDDQLPIGRGGQLLCSYSSNKNELWISLLEKAYMKVMGGYDFPGSNSNIDLHSLTGWIPERITIRVNDPEFNKDAVFKKLLDRFHKGDVLITVATGDLSDADADRAGLVSTHAYAVLGVREVEGVRLFLVKNPWSHLRWRGNYSELDTIHWTPELKNTLSYDPNSAAMFDNGVFWIDYDSICRFFDVFYLNWNPGLFSYTSCVHQSWRAGSGPVKDVYNIGDNPQYSLEVNASGPSAVWILLTRHITELEDFKENKEYITVVVYKTDGKKVYYPYDPSPYIDGVRINSPHYLCKILLSNAGIHRFTLVVSQYEKSNTIHYTLRGYSTSPFTLRKIANPFKYKNQITDGKWSGTGAGGCANHRDTYKNNPRYQISLQSGIEHQLLIDLKGPKQYQIGFDVVCVIANNPQAKGYFQKKSSGSFRPGFVILELSDVPSGTYDIIPCTFNPNQEGPFFLTVQASTNFTINRMQ